MSPIPRSLAALGVALLLSSGCYRFEWSPEPIPAVINTAPSRVWVPVGADSFVVLLGARLVADSVTGLVEHSAPPGHPLTRYTAATAGIPRVALERLNWPYTGRNALALTILLGTVVFGGFIRGGGR